MKGSRFPKSTLCVRSLLILALFVFLSILFYPFHLKDLPDSKLIFDKKGIEIGEIPYEKKIRHRKTEYDEIPEFYKRVLIYWEDRSFYNNIGISPSGIIRSIINNFKSDTGTQGASTISAQLVRNNLWLNEKRTFGRKILETIYSIMLNIRYSKKEIIGKYANQVYFGYMNYGLSSASHYYFGKDLHDLTDAEALALFTIQKNSNRYDPYKNRKQFDNRFKMIANKLRAGSAITDSKYDELLGENIIFNRDHYNKLPYVSDFIESASNGKYPFIRVSSKITPNIHSTIDSELTEAISRIANNALYELSWKNVKDYSVVITDRKTNDLLVLIGGKDYYSKEGQVNSALALRQPGSTMKPFTYVLASKILGMKPDDSILDLPVLYKTKEGYSYEPQNYSTSFEGQVTTGEALAQSMNVPAVKTLEKIGVQTLLDFMRSLGVRSLDKDADHYGLALTLGDGEITLYELLRAYSIFSNDGKFCDFRFIDSQKQECKQIIDKKFTDNINSILTDRYLKIGGYPINSALDFQNISVFFKTGTSRNFRDNWTIGYTDDYMIGVWAGNKDATNMKGVSGATGAGEIFSRIVRLLEKPSEDKLLKSAHKKSEPFLEITSPLDGQVYKIDKDFPLDIQKIGLTFSSNLDSDEKEWYLDGRRLQTPLLDLTVGNHELLLELKHNGETSLSKKVRYEVLEDD